MYTCMCVCMYVCMYVCTYVCICVCVCVYIYIYIYIALRPRRALDPQPPWPPETNKRIVVYSLYYMLKHIICIKLILCYMLL